MGDSTQHTVTGLLQAWGDGDECALERMMPLVYDELHRLASLLMGPERKDHTLQTTALVHEVYLRLVGAEIPWKDRIHFYSVAARCMRRILVDHARKHRTDRRGGGQPHIPLDEGQARSPTPPVAVIDLDNALDRLREQDGRKADLVELHYFAGLTQIEIGEGLELSPKQVGRELRLARAWLLDALTPPEGGSPRD